MRAPEFQGLSDSLAAHKWKEDIGNILEILNMISVQKKRLTSYSLKGDAGRWYQLQFTPEQRMTLTWEDFIYFFDGQYISSAARTQGDMTVADFKSRFMDLLHFMGMWQTGERQAQIFLAGLRPNLGRYLVSRRFYSVREVAEAATSQEIETTMFQKDKEGKAKAGQSGDKGKNKRPLSGHQHQHQQ